MKIVIITVGTLGDTAPFIGLGLRLKAAGHDVAVAAQSAFAAPIVEAGLEFRPMPGDIRELLASEHGQRLHRAGCWLNALSPALRVAEQLLSELGDGIVEAAQGADLLILHRIALMHGYLVAEAMNIPFLTVELFPSGLVPTSEFLPATFGAASLGRVGNRAVYALLRTLAHGAGRNTAFLRRFQRRFGLPRVTPSDLYRRLRRERWPVYHAFSAHVVPRPRDWGSQADVIGYLWPPSAPQYRPPERLLDFLGAGPPPVFVGFGSLMPSEMLRVSQVVLEAARRAKVRAVLQAGWGELGHDGRHDDVLSIGSVPHEWLFQRVAAVVHAAGAGVTAAGLRAGVPAVPLPAMNDQPFWADRLRKVGVSPGSLRFQSLTAEALAPLLERAVSQPSYTHTARSLARAVQREDAAARVIEAVAEAERSLA